MLAFTNFGLGVRNAQRSTTQNAGALLMRFLNAPHTINNRPLKTSPSYAKLKTEPPGWTTAAASFYFYLASARLAPIVALASNWFCESIGSC
jgi:hypothetical protein